MVNIKAYCFPVKIIFPAEAQKAEKTLRGLGFNDICDKVITSLNRAAEEAAKEALPIFMSSIKQMTLKDASNILLAKDQDAATQYFKTTTTSQLSEKFKPIIQSNLDKARCYQILDNSHQSIQQNSDDGQDQYRSE